MAEEFGNPQSKLSRWWYLLAIILGPIGGIVGYFVVRNRDKKFAEKLLIVGLVMIAVWWVLSIALAGLAYLYISGTFQKATATVLSIDGSTSTCSGNTITVYVRNDGTQNSGQVSITTQGASCTITDISPGLEKSCSLTKTGGSGTYPITVTTSSSSARGSIYCS